MKKAFICSPYYSSTPEGIEYNLNIARHVTKYAALSGLSPITPHLLYPQILYDKDETRDLAIAMGLSFLDICDMVIAFTGNGVSQGMKDELKRSKEKSIPTYFMVDLDAIHNDPRQNNKIEDYSVMIYKAYTRSDIDKVYEKNYNTYSGNLLKVEY